MKSYFYLTVLCLCTFFSSQAQFNAPDWARNATIYEVNMRQFTPEGTFIAFQKHLPRLKEMGVDILWIMPINPIGNLNRKGSLGSYYAVKDYKAINPEYGTELDFKYLVKSAHALGMKVIVDWVANHTSPDNLWVDQGHKDWYTLDSIGNLQPTIGTDWWDVADLNYDNQEMRLAMIDAMKYWIKTADIDGYRCDVAGWVPADFWKQARTELMKIKPVFMLAEAEGADIHDNFDMTYGWEFHHIMNDIAKGKKNAIDIQTYLNNEKKYPANAYRMHFTSNHDENSWNGTEMERMGDARFALAVLAATIQGMPLVYNGQETSLDRRLLFFEKDSISWLKMDLVDFYTDLLQLHHHNEALWNGLNGGEVVWVSDVKEGSYCAFTREKNGDKVLCILNLSNADQEIVLNGASVPGKYHNIFTDKSTRFKNGCKVSLAPWGYQVFEK